MFHLFILLIPVSWFCMRFRGSSHGRAWTARKWQICGRGYSRMSREILLVKVETLANQRACLLCVRQPSTIAKNRWRQKLWMKNLLWRTYWLTANNMSWILQSKHASFLRVEMFRPISARVLVSSVHVDPRQVNKLVIDFFLCNAVLDKNRYDSVILPRNAT